MKSYSRLSFLHQRAEGNYSVDHSLLAFLLPPTEARASATVAETVPRLPYLHICIIKTFVRIWRNIVRRRDEEHNILRQKTLWLNKSHGTQHLCLSICPRYYGNSCFSVAVATRQAPRPPRRQSVFTAVDALTFSAPSFGWSQALWLSEPLTVRLHLCRTTIG